MQEVPVYRFSDFLTARFNSGSFQFLQYPIITQRDLMEEITIDSITTLDKRDGISDEKMWHWYAQSLSYMGHASRDFTGQDSFFDETDYMLHLTLSFGDVALERPVKRNILIRPIWKNNDFNTDYNSVPILHPADVGANNPYIFEDGVTCEMGSQQFPYTQFWDSQTWPNYFYSRHVVLGPVPARVPKSVMGGQPFYYNTLSDVKLFSELPFGCLFNSEFYDENYNLISSFPIRIEWTATITNSNDLHVTIDDDTQTSQTAQTTTLESGNTIPEILLTFTKANPNGPDFQDNFSVTVSAKAKVVTSADGLQHTEYNLGQFTTDFEFVETNNSTSPQHFAHRQAAELRGLGAHIPEGDSLLGGQRQKTLEPERKIGVTGQPAPNASTFVDALTGRFHHSETDYALPIPGSDLSLALTRHATDSIWSDAFGIRPTENPLLPFGPGWDSNLAAALIRTLSLTPEGNETTAPTENPRRLISTITVRDYQGRPYTFFEYTNGENLTTFLPDPTLIPGRDTTDITLTRATDGTYTLTQPLLGITHTYASSTASIRIPNNRDTALIGTTHASGFTRNHYHRLTHITDRFDVTLLYTYTNSTNLLPQQIHVADRTNLRLRFLQENGRITAFWDPAGIKHSYTHETRNLAPTGQPAAPYQILASHNIGTRHSASYGYHYAIQADPRPEEMLAPRVGSTSLYRIPTHHLAPSTITRGNQETLTIHYTFSQVRSAWSAAAEEYYHPAGDPLIVEAITLPNATEVEFSLLHTLKNGRPARPATDTEPAVAAIPAHYQITTQVTDYRGTHWTYAYATPNTYRWQLPQADAPHLPTATALFFPSLTRTCEDIDHSSVTFHYSANAGFALTKSTDAAQRSTTATYSLPHTPAATPYSRPTATGAIPLHAYYPQPTSTTNLLGHSTHYEYSNNTNPLLHHLPETITDSRNRRITLHRDSLARQTSLTLHDAENTLLSQVDHAHTNTTFPGVLTRLTRKDLAHPTDPAWVTDLITDIHHDTLGFPQRIGNDAASLHSKTTHSPSGRILEQTTPAGATTTYTFDTSGLLTTITLADGTTRHYQYDEAARLVITRDAIGNATGYQYDTLGRPTATIRDINGDLSHHPTHGLTGIQPEQDIITSTQYLDATRTHRHIDPRGYITELQLDPIGRLTTVITPAPETEPGILPTVENDHVTHYQYSLQANPTQPTKITDPLGYATHFHFDEFARLETILREYATDGTTKLHSGLTYNFSETTGLPNSVTTHRSPLDEEGNLLDPFATTLTQQIEYDILDRPRQTIHAAGTDKEQITRHTYTSTGIPYLTETRQSHTPTETWATYNTEYDALARITKQLLPSVTDATTNLVATPYTAIHYDSAGRVDSTSNAYGHHTHFGYDTLGRLTWEKLPPVLDARSGQTARPTTIRQYDPRGLPIKTIDPLGYAWQTTFDSIGRPITTTSPILRPELPTGQQRATTHFHYDQASNLIQTTDANGHTTTHTYQPDGLPATTNTHIPDQTPHTTSYQYNPLGNLTQLTDPQNQTTTWTHDGLGRTLTSTRDPGDTTRQKIETTEYDALLPTAHIDPANRRREYIYDDQLRLHQLNHIGHSAENLTFTHDLLGRLTHIAPTTAPTDPELGNPAIARSYDILGRLTSETSNTITTQHHYDLLHQLTRTETQSPSPQTITNTYDNAGRKTTSTTSYPLLTAHSPLTTSYQHNLRGETITQTYPNGLQQTNTLDPAGRLTAQTIRPQGAESYLTRTEYQYDHLSNLTHLRETFASALNIPSRTLTNTYNQRSQLLTETQTETGGPLGTTTRTRNETHTYDPAENRLSTHIHQTDPTTGTTEIQRHFTYGSPSNGYNANQLHTLTETTNSGTPLVTHFTYDPNGNRLTKTIGEDTDHYHYDLHNRLTKLEIETSSPAENNTYHYRYDPQTRRIARSIGETPNNTNTSHFAFSGRSPIHQWEGSATTPDWTHQRANKHHTSTGGNPIHDATNLRNDITAQYNANGTLQWHGQYASNGMLTRQYGTKASTYGANSKYEEPAGLLNEGFRYRDRTTNTFLTRDPLGYIDGPNDYNYVRHNPWSAWDPLGLSEESTATPRTSGDVGYYPSGVTFDLSNLGSAYQDTIQQAQNQSTVDPAGSRLLKYQTNEDSLIDYYYGGGSAHDSRKTYNYIRVPGNSTYDNQTDNFHDMLHGLGYKSIEGGFSDSQTAKKNFPLTGDHYHPYWQWTSTDGKTTVYFIPMNNRTGYPVYGWAVTDSWEKAAYIIDQQFLAAPGGLYSGSYLIIGSAQGGTNARIMQLRQYANHLIPEYRYVPSPSPAPKPTPTAQEQNKLVESYGGEKIISTGRTIPNSLKEKLAMEEVMANPLGTTPPRMPPMTDTKNNLLAADGWVKRAQNVNGVEIHYVENTKTGQVLDFKFKD